MSQLFSKEDSFSEKQPSILAEMPEEVLYEWCKSDVDIAPVFVAHATDVYVKGEDEYLLSPRARFLIDEFGDNEKVLSALSVNMGSFGWSGSIVPIYRKEVAALIPLRQHKLSSVKEWANKRISYLNKRIEKENQLDAESEWGIR